MTHEFPGKADIHVHTTASDGHSDVRTVLRAAQRAGLHVIAITDHDTIDAALEARQLAPDYGVELIVGEEVSTREGHLLALWIERRLAPGRPMADTIAEVHAAGGLCVVAHPFGWMVSSVGAQLRKRWGTDWPVDGVEAFNASLPFAWTNRWAAQFAAASGLPAVGGSDAHHAATVGAGLTRFPGTRAVELRAAVLACRTIAEGQGWSIGAGIAHLARQAQSRPRMKGYSGAHNQGTR